MARKPMDVQSVIVDASRYSLEEARAKVKKMGYKVTKVDKPEEGETQEHYRFRQRAPGQFEKFRYHKLKRKTKKGEQETGVQLVLAKSVHLLVKAVGHKYLKRVMTPTGYRYIYQEHSSVKQAAAGVGKKGSPAARKLASLIQRSHSAVGKHISDKAHDAVMAAKFHGKRRTKEHLDKIENVHAEHRKKIGAAIEDARGKGKITHAEAIKLKNFHDKHGGSLANAIERLKGLTRDPKSALAQKSFHLVKAAGAGARPHKYVKRIARPGGGFRYFYAEPAAAISERGKPEEDEKAAEAKMIHSELDAEVSKVTPRIEALGRLAQKYLSQGKENLAIAKVSDAKAVMSEANRKVWTKLDDSYKDAKITHSQYSEIEHARAKKLTSMIAMFPVWEVSAIVDAKKKLKTTKREKLIEENRRKEKEAVTESIRQARRGNMDSSKWHRKDALLYGKVAVLLESGGLKEATTKGKTITKKSFTEDNAMNDELSLSQREGERIAKAVLEDEEARVEKMVKAVIEVPSYGKTKKKTIPDDRVIDIFRAYIRTRYRSNVRWNEATGPQALYDSILSGAEHTPITEAALGVLEKRKTPFSVDYVKACIAEVQDAQKEAEKIAPEPTEPASIAASGG